MGYIIASLRGGRPTRQSLRVAESDKTDAKHAPHALMLGIANPALPDSLRPLKNTASPVIRCGRA
ncbi:MAG TPA: hypothetical protein VMT53_06765 [Terriglobales bacterium]|nr:hypothetical protein [Terriglobales bacterium]